MRRLAELLSDLAEAPHTAARHIRLVDYFAEGTDDLGWTAAWLTGALRPKRITPAKLRAMAEARVDAELFRISASALGDVGETTALIWPGAGDAPVASVAAGDLDLPDMLDQLDAEARVALVRLVTGRKIKGVKPAEVHAALAKVFCADAALIAGAMIEEAPPYPRLTAWLMGEGPAPNWAPPSPPDLPRLTGGPPPGSAVWLAPDGEPVAIEAGRAFDANGAERPLKVAAEDGWGFLKDGVVTDITALTPLSDPDRAHESGATLLLRLPDGGWALRPPEARSMICPVTFIETGRTVAITLGVVAKDEVAPLIKLPAPNAAKVSAFARKAMIDKFGPVRQVGPGLWAEVTFEGVRPAPRRKIGLTLDGARIARLIWSDDGPAAPDLSVFEP